LFGAFGVLVLVSFGYSVWFTRVSALEAYFVTPARAWEFGAGGLLAFAPRITAIAWLSDKWRGVIQICLSWFGLCLIGGSFVFFDAKMALPGVLAVVPVFGALCVIWADHCVNPLSATYLGDFAPVQFLGDISYSLYLWHWPVVVLYPIIRGHAPETKGGLAILLLCVAIAALSKRFIEDPFRFRRFWLKLSWRPVVFAVTAMTLIVTAAQVLSYVGAKEAQRQAELAARLADGAYPCFGANALLQPNGTCDDDPLLKDDVWPATNKEDDRIGQLGCWRDSNSESLRPCTYGEQSLSALRVAIVGDSHALFFSSAVIPETGNLGWQVDTFIGGNCVWQDPMYEEFPACAELMANFVASDYDMIITVNITAREWTKGEAAVAASQAAWSAAVANGAQVVVLTDNPKIPKETMDYFNNNRDSYRNLAEITFPASSVLLPNWQIEAAKATPGVTLIDLTEFYCPNGICPIAIGNVLLYRDTNHLTRTYWKTLWPYVLAQLPIK
jgi:hypothetical protein